MKDKCCVKSDLLIAIKPCPFCGGQPEIGPLNPEVEGDGWAAIYCPNPECLIVRTELYSDDENKKELIISKWNQRASI